MAAPHLKVISHDTYAAWFEQQRGLLQHCSPFHHPAWLAAVGKTLPFEVVFVGGYYGHELVAALPGVLTRRGPFRLFGSPLRGTMTSELGPVGLALPSTAPELFDSVQRYSRFARKQWGVEYTEVALREFPVAQHDLGGGWERSERCSYRLLLDRDEAALWAALKPRARRHIRKAQQLGIRIVPLDDARLYYRMLDETFARRGTSGWHPEHFFRVLLDELVPQQVVWALGAEYEGQIIAAGLFLRDDQELYYLSGASFSHYRYLPTSYLLHWHVITSAVRAGIQVYDFAGRGNIPSIDHFKESFSPQPTVSCSLSWAPPHVRYAKRLFLSSLPYVRRFKRWIT